MEKISLADKLKIIFSPERGKDVLKYTYENVIKPNIKQTAFVAGQIFLARQLGLDEKTIPTIPTIGTTYTSYASCGKGTKGVVDVKSYLPSTTPRADISTIAFNSQTDAKDLLDYMKKCIEGPLKCCRVSDVYEHLGMPINGGDVVVGWRTMMGIGLLPRNGVIYIATPTPERL